MSKKTKAETVKKPDPAVGKTKPPKKPIESIGLKAMRNVGLNDDSEVDSPPVPKPAKKPMSPLAALKEELPARAVEVTNGRISLDSALNNIADQRRLEAAARSQPRYAEPSIIKELAPLLRK